MLCPLGLAAAFNPQITTYITSDWAVIIAGGLLVGAAEHDHLAGARRVPGAVFPLCPRPNLTAA
ncbi:MAG: hypothetical protein HRU31_12745 [Rhodobacteraceae bacterium]|nr:hypothetical protein [Paracoccaceae bacterium]